MCAGLYGHPAYPVLYQFCGNSIGWLSCTPISFR